MTAYIARRVLAVLPVMAVVALFVFFLLRLAPGDPAAIIAGDDATAESIAAVRAKLGLDRPVIEQFVVWLWGLLHGDLGVSIFSNLPVTRLIRQRLERLDHGQTGIHHRRQLAREDDEVGQAYFTAAGFSLFADFLLDGDHQHVAVEQSRYGRLLGCRFHRTADLTAGGRFPGYIYK